MQMYQKQIDYFSENYTNSPLYNNPNAFKDYHVRPISKEEQNRMSRSASSWCYQFSLLAKRNFLNLLRLPQTSYVKLIVTLLTAGFCIILFARVGQDLAGVQNRNGSLFFITMVLSFNAIQNVILIFPDERPVFLREANNGMYRVSAYFWAKMFSELPVGILTPSIFSATVYYAIGYNTATWFKFPLFGKYFS